MSLNRNQFVRHKHTCICYGYVYSICVIYYFYFHNVVGIIGHNIN